MCCCSAAHHPGGRRTGLKKVEWSGFPACASLEEIVRYINEAVGRSEGRGLRGASHGLFGNKKTHDRRRRTCALRGAMRTPRSSLKKRFELTAAVPSEIARVGALTPQIRELTRVDDLEERSASRASIIAFAQLPEPAQAMASARKKAFEVDPRSSRTIRSSSTRSSPGRRERARRLPVQVWTSGIARPAARSRYRPRLRAFAHRAERRRVDERGEFPIGSCRARVARLLASPCRPIWAAPPRHAHHRDGDGGARRWRRLHRADARRAHSLCIGHLLVARATSEAPLDPPLASGKHLGAWGSPSRLGLRRDRCTEHREERR